MKLLEKIRSIHILTSGLTHTLLNKNETNIFLVKVTSKASK